jgi:hypothetical protein
MHAASRCCAFRTALQCYHSALYQNLLARLMCARVRTLLPPTTPQRTLHFCRRRYRAQHGYDSDVSDIAWDEVFDWEDSGGCAAGSAPWCGLPASCRQLVPHATPASSHLAASRALPVRRTWVLGLTPRRWLRLCGAVILELPEAGLLAHPDFQPPSQHELRCLPRPTRLSPQKKRDAEAVPDELIAQAEARCRAAEAARAARKRQSGGIGSGGETSTPRKRGRPANAAATEQPRDQQGAAPAATQQQQQERQARPGGASQPGAEATQRQQLSGRSQRKASQALRAHREPSRPAAPSQLRDPPGTLLGGGGDDDDDDFREAGPSQRMRVPRAPQTEPDFSRVPDPEGAPGAGLLKKVELHHFMVRRAGTGGWRLGARERSRRGAPFVWLCRVSAGVGSRCWKPLLRGPPAPRSATPTSSPTSAPTSTCSPASTAAARARCCRRCSAAWGRAPRRRGATAPCGSLCSGGRRRRSSK